MKALGFFKESCQTVGCSENVPKGSKFCRQCGASRAGQFWMCMWCGAEVAGDSRHCHSCGQDLTQQPFKLTLNQKWFRTKEQIAIRFPLRTTQNIQNKGIQLDDGTTGHVYKDGVYQDLLKPGFNEFVTLWEKLRSKQNDKENIYAILTEANPFFLLFSLREIFTQDHLPLDVDLKVKVQLHDARAFIERYMQSSLLITLDDLVDLYRSDVRARLQEVARQYSTEAFLKDNQRRAELDRFLSDSLQEVFSHYGLSYLGIHNCEFGGLAFEAWRKRRVGQAEDEDDLKTLAKLNEIKQNKKDREAEREVKTAQALDGVSIEAMIASVKDPLVKKSLLRLESIRHSDPRNLSADIDWTPLAPQAAPTTSAFSSNPYGSITPLQPLQFGSTPSSASAPSDHSSFKDFTQAYRTSIGLIGRQVKGEPSPLGTGFLIAPDIVVTNAHVAEPLLNAGTSWVAFPQNQSVMGEMIRVQGISLHPQWIGSERAKAEGNPLPAYDIALIHLESPASGKPLQLGVQTPAPAESVAFMGYPMDGIVYGGVMAEKPEPVFQQGTISRLTDWTLGSTELPDLIEHSCPIAAGASGSPLVNSQGQVVGIVSAGNHSFYQELLGLKIDSDGNPALQMEPRRTSHAAQLNYAQCIKILGDLL